MNFARASGILLHPTSLPGEFGIGDFGDEAASFIEFLVRSGQKVWQVLPLGPTGYGDSPYQCFSAFAGNTTLISPRRLVEAGLLHASDLERSPLFPVLRIDYGKAQEFKQHLLQRAFENFKRSTDSALKGEFDTFCEREAAWLDDYALYRALKDAHEGKAWNTWEPELARREARALKLAKEKHDARIKAQKFFQFLFFKQWSAIKASCRERGIRIIGDLPIFVAHDSADVWVRPELFKLEPDGRPKVVAGVPPDYFSKTGQLWGNPIYDWAEMRAQGFAWWKERTRAALELFDIIRLDHFRGFAASWEVPGTHPTAEHGAWVEAPGRELFGALKETLKNLPVIAEDLGVITPDVEALRDDFGFPGMRVLQFAFGGDAGSPHLPHNYNQNCVAYTGTHDNDTTKGWFESLKGEAEYQRRTREHCLRYLGTEGAEIHWEMIRAAQASVAHTAIAPLQDVLGLGTEGRMNLPASTGGNWNWRFIKEALTEKLTERLRGLAELYGR